jgi:hypothetical protein
MARVCPAAPPASLRLPLLFAGATRRLQTAGAVGTRLRSGPGGIAAGLLVAQHATVYALGLVLIASVYIGFAIADGRRSVLVVETSVATVFVIVAAAAVTGSPWLLVVGLAGHGLKDLWQHRRQFVANTRWWPPFCLVVDWVAATVIAVEIVAGVHFHH